MEELSKLFAQVSYIYFVVPILALALYSLFKRQIQGETDENGNKVEESSVLVRAIILIMMVGTMFFIPYILMHK